jgi:acetyl-CoA acetyltransferase
VEAVRFKEKNGITVKEPFMQDFDDGVRADTTIEGLAKLRPAFAAMVRSLPATPPRQQTALPRPSS